MLRPWAALPIAAVLAGCVPAQSPQPPRPLLHTVNTYHRSEIQAEITQAGTLVVVRAERGLCDVHETELDPVPTTPGSTSRSLTFDTDKMSFKGLFASIGLIGASAFLGGFLIPKSHTTDDYAQSITYTTMFGATGLGVLIWVLYDAADVRVSTIPPTYKTLSDTWKKRAACRPLVVAQVAVGLRRPDGGILDVGKTDDKGQIRFDLLDHDLSVLGGARKATLVVGEKDAGSVDLPAAASAH